MAKMRSLYTSVTLTALVSSVIAIGVNETQYVRQVKHNDEIECIAVQKDIMYPPGVDATNLPTEFWCCELLESTAAANGNSGKIYELQDLEQVNIQDGVVSSPTNLTLEDSGISTLTIEGATITQNSKIKLKGSKVKIARKRKNKVKDDNNVVRIDDDDNDVYNSTRRLQRSGRKKVLAVRVSALDSSNPLNATWLSNKIFGTQGDKNNLVTGFRDCSYNKLIFEPVSQLESTQLLSLGVVEVSVPINVNSVAGSVVQEAVTDELNKRFPNIKFPKYGYPISAETPFNHVMYCLPPAVASFGAYGYTNGWLTVYSTAACDKALVQMHEFGHNLGLIHASLLGSADAYTDRTGCQGYVDWHDEGPPKCFNAPNSFLLGWYSESAPTITPLAPGFFSWTGKLKGLVDYGTQNTDSVIVKLETVGARHYYLSFNRRTGINSGTISTQGDKVLLARQEGAYPTQTKLVSILSSGGTTFISNFGGSGQPVQIRVNNIDLSAFPAFADVTVTYGCNSDAQCGMANLFACTIDKCNVSTQRCEEAPVAGCFCDNTCSSSTESAASCPSDCGVSGALTTGPRGTGNNNGNMFDVRAIKDVYIKSFEIYVNEVETTVSAKVYTKPGSYLSYEQDVDAWQLIQSRNVLSSASTTPLTKLPLLDKPLLIRAGSTQAFYITLAFHSLKYTPAATGVKAGNLLTQDGYLQFFQGVGKQSDFRATYDLRTWNGVINYRYAPLFLETIIEPQDGQAGNMFDILPSRTVTITGFDIHARTQGKNLVGYVYRKTTSGSYVGSENNQGAWTLMQSFTVTSQGAGILTPLPPLATTFQIPANTRWAFYITLTTSDLRYKRGTSAGNLFKADGSIQVFEGAGKKYPINAASPNTFTPRIWNGRIYYI